MKSGTHWTGSLCVGPREYLHVSGKIKFFRSTQIFPGEFWSWKLRICYAPPRNPVKRLRGGLPPRDPHKLMRHFSSHLILQLKGECLTPAGSLPTTFQFKKAYEPPPSHPALLQNGFTTRCFINHWDRSKINPIRILKIRKGTVLAKRHTVSTCAFWTSMFRIVRFMTLIFRHSKCSDYCGHYCGQHEIIVATTKLLWTTRNYCGHHEITVPNTKLLWPPRNYYGHHEITVATTKLVCAKKLLWPPWNYCGHHEISVLQEITVATTFLVITVTKIIPTPSRRPRGLRRRSAAAWLLGSWVRIPLRVLMLRLFCLLCVV
jgi:hypothetical protein